MELLYSFITNYWLYAIISAAAAYFISSVNTSIIVTGIVKHQDIRKMGSGNAGFTNVLRCVGKVPAIITFVGDFLKGVVSVLIPYFMTINMTSPEDQLYRGLLMYLAGLFAVLGHMFPVYYKFKGGKGVVTTASVILMTDWRVLVLELLLFAVLFIVTKTISKCSLANAAFYPFFTATMRLIDSTGFMSAIAPTPAPTPMFIICLFVMTFINGLAIIVRHKDNIKRILNGTEKKITSSK